MMSDDRGLRARWARRYSDAAACADLLVIPTRRLAPGSERTKRFSAPPTAAHAPTNRELLDAERAERL
ncbi:hypothetical protein BH23ACT6_BH23ACT6_18750 [soil metagenome]